MMTVRRLWPCTLAIFWCCLLLPISLFAQAPMILSNPAGVSVVSGSNAAFSALASGAAPLRFQWQLFGTNLPGRTNFTLAITNVSVDFGGVYTLVVTNSSGSATSAPALLSVDEHLTFRLLQLQTNGAIAFECNTVTGDDRGGLVASPDFVFLTGDNSTARFSAGDLTGATGLGRIYDSLCSNLRDERIYVLANGTNIIVSGGGTINALLELDGTTGLLNGNRINLSTNISMFSGAIFSGFGRIVLMDGNRNVYDVLLPSGAVTFRGRVNNLQRSSSENWVSWGLAEYFANTLQLVYVESGFFPYTNIARIRVATDSFSTPVAGFTSPSGLADMASLGFSTSRSRWYFHYEGTGQFRSGDETIGSAKAIYSTNAGVPFIYQQPQARTAYPGTNITLSVLALGNGPFSYQWKLNGTNLNAPDSATLVLSNVEPSVTGNYSVDVANAAGSVSSDGAFVFVIGAPQILIDPQTQSALAGSNVLFDVAYLAAPPVFFQWRHDGTNIPSATNATYNIPFASTADAGTYDVLVTNRYGSATSGVATFALIVQSAYSFKILSLGDDAVIAEHLEFTGSDYGGIGVSSNRVFVTGNAATALFSAADLGSPVVAPNFYDSLVTDLRTETVYSLGDSNNLFSIFTGNPLTTLIEINGTNGARTTNIITLSAPIPMNYYSGLFSGYGQIVLHNGSRVYSIAVPSGVVADLGDMYPPQHQYSASWAYWGLAENFGGAVYLVYAQDSQSIVRTRVPDGLSTSIANFLNLADMASIGASVSRGRWYFHYQGPSQFGVGNETVGFCSAAFSVTPNPIVDHFSWEPLPGAQFSGVPFAATITARTIENTIVSNYGGSVSLAGVATANGTPVSVLPGASGNFSNGVWTGQLVVPDPTPGVSIRAADPAGHFGLSSPFAVVTTNDLAVQLVPSTNAATLYAALTYYVFVTNSGPEVSSGIFVTNILPANINFISATPSQGTCSVNGGVVVCDIGTMPSGTSEVIEIILVPNSLATLTNAVQVIRSASENHLENNVAVAITPVSMPAITINDPTALEGDSVTSRGTNVFTIQLNTTSAVPVSVRYATAPGTAIVGDYATRSGLIVFAPGVTSTNINVILGGEVNYELNEYFFMNLSSVTNAILVRTQAVGTIVNDDPPPVLVAPNVSVTEGNSGSALVSFPIRLSASAGVPISVNWATSNGTAVAGSDFTPASGLLNFTNGNTNLFISLNITGDTLGESNEFFYINFFNGTNITVNTQMLVVIMNDDALGVDHFSFSPIGGAQLLNAPIPLTITALDFSNHVLANFTGTVNLSGVGGAGDGTVTVGNNTTTWFEPLYTYWHDSRTQVIYPSSDLRGVQRIRSLALNVTTLPGQALNNWTIRMKHTSKTDFSANGGFETADWTTVYRANTTVSSLGWVTFNFSTPFDYNGVDNLMIDFSHNNSSYTTEGNVAATIAPTLRTVYYYCDSCQGDPLSWSGGSPGFNLASTVPDIRLVTSGASLKVAPTNTVNFTNGVWNGNVVVLEPGDPVRLQAADTAQHVGVSGSFAVGLADDIAVRIVPSANPVPTNENLAYFITVSNSGPSTSTGVFMTNLLPANATYVSSATDRGSVSANAGKVIANIGTLASGEVASITVAVHPNGPGPLTNAAMARRNEPEPYLGNNSQTNIVTALALALSVADAFVVEGQSGATNMIFNVSLSAASTQTVSVTYHTMDSSADASDYQSASGLLLFAPGVTNRAVPVVIYGDLLNEFDEQLLFVLDASTNAPFARATATGTIVNDDPLPMISISDIAVAEGRNGLTPATFTLTLSRASGKTVTVNALTSDGTALASDYVLTNAFVTFQPGQTAVPLTVFINGDSAFEPDEYFLVTLYNPGNATLAAAEVRCTILNDDSGAGVFDHFEWSLIPSPQTTNRSFSVTLTARDGLNVPFAFNGTVALSAMAGTNVLRLAPSNTTAFVNGVWSGPLTLHGAGTNVVLIANDGAGHIGISNPFDITVADLALSVSAPPQVLIASPFTYTLTITNRGADAATAAVATDSLPVDASFVSANTSAGSCAFVNGIVTCNLGTISNGAVVTVAISLNPWRGGPLANMFSVAAFEADPVLSNNLAPIVVEITGDEDHDGLPDSWELQHGFSSSNPNDANLDSDGDGHTNLQEYIAGTDPRSAASLLKVTARVDSLNAEIRFLTVLDKHYVLERAPSPAGPWATIGTEVIGDGDVVILFDPDLAAGAQFYRVRVVR